MYRTPEPPTAANPSASNSSSSPCSENAASIDVTNTNVEISQMEQPTRANGTNLIQPSFPSIVVSGASTSSRSFSNTPTRPARILPSEMTLGGGMPRSSSAPIERDLRNNTKTSSISPPSNIPTPDTLASNRHQESNVKHLTCYWWKEKGHCRFSDEQCLYAHYDTGHYTDPPRQVVPGEPALAGRKLGRAIRELALNPHRTSACLSSMPGSRHNSRPATPVFAPDYNTFHGLGSPMTSPTPLLHSGFSSEHDLARLNNDLQLFRSLVDSNTKEKAVMINTIEKLEAEKKGLEGELDGVRRAQEQLLAERDGLRRRIAQLEKDRSQRLPMPRTATNPYGAIGRGSIGAEARYIGGLLNED